MLWNLICTLVSGGIVGWLAGKIMHREGGLIRNIIVGIVGSALGGFLCSLIGIYAYGWIFGAVVNVAGACLLLWILHKLLG